MQGTPASLRDFLRLLVCEESPSHDAAGLRRVFARYAEALEELGARIQWAPPSGDPNRQPPSAPRLPTLLADLGPQAGPSGSDAPLLVVGHLDTVHPLGTLAGPLPWREVEGRLYGPGVYDMKGGLAALVSALVRMKLRGWALPGPLRIVVTPDEETGSASSRALLEAEGARARGALVLEPPLPGGGPKVRRKGVGEYRIRVSGIPAHAGIEPERGASAIHALGELIPSLLALADPPSGTTLNVGSVTGGGVLNVVADRAELHVDLRVRTGAEALRVDQALRALGVSDPRIRVEVQGGINRGPMEPTPESTQILQVATQVSSALGRASFPGGESGGGSDGNLLAAVGCPVLDGLGVEGDGAHTHEEYILAGDLEWRGEFYAHLLREL
jgi:glutamate carboxypeptidase